jgi:hypothetical protein
MGKEQTERKEGVMNEDTTKIMFPETPYLCINQETNRRRRSHYEIISAFKIQRHH